MTNDLNLTNDPLKFNSLMINKSLVNTQPGLKYKSTKFIQCKGTSENRKDLQASTLVGLTWENPSLHPLTVLHTLAVLHLNNQLYVSARQADQGPILRIKNCSFFKFAVSVKTDNFEGYLNLCFYR